MPPARLLIRSHKQLRTLVSASRQEIVDVLAQLGTVSVADLAATLGRPADALYFHLRALVAAGLVRQAGHRRVGGRRLALFRTVAPELALRYEPASATNRAAVSAIVRAMLRLGMRDFSRALGRDDVQVEGARRELWALRRIGRVSPARLTGVNEAIKQLVKVTSKTRGKGRLYAVTVVLTPLPRRTP